MTYSISRFEDHKNLVNLSVFLYSANMSFLKKKVSMLTQYPYLCKCACNFTD